MPNDHRAYQPKLDFTRDATLEATAPLTVSSEATEEATTPLANASDAMLDALAAEFRAIESVPDPTIAATLEIAVEIEPLSAEEYSHPAFSSWSTLPSGTSSVLSAAT
jgi:hypothetical protein